jgi:type I restriction enzyme, S subunit
LAGLRMKATGTSGRKRITPEAFVDIRIPLPSLEEQHAIVAAYNAALARAAELELDADTVESAAVAAFEAALGFGPSAPLPDRPMFVASFKELDRWSHEGILRRLVEGGSTYKSTYPLVRLRDVIGDLENGWSPKCHNRPADDDEWGVLKVSAASVGRYREQENKALPAGLKPRPRLEVRPGDVLITRASGVARLVGVGGLC